MQYRNGFASRCLVYPQFSGDTPEEAVQLLGGYGCFCGNEYGIGDQCSRAHVSPSNAEFRLLQAGSAFSISDRNSPSNGLAKDFSHPTPLTFASTKRYHPLRHSSSGMRFHFPSHPTTRRSMGCLLAFCAPVRICRISAGSESHHRDVLNPHRNTCIT